MDPAIADDEQPGTEADAAERVIESAKRLGVELDAHEAAEWVAAMSTEASGGDVVVDVDSGVYGHRVTMLDFQPADLARFREMSTIVGFEDRPPQVADRALDLRVRGAEQDPAPTRRTAISSSASTSRPTTRAEACAILARADAREGAATRRRVRLTACGRSSSASHPVAATNATASRCRRARRCPGRPRRSRAGQIEVTLADGSLRVYTLGGRRARAGLVQARLGRRGPRPRAARQREQRAGSDVGGAGRHDHAARRLPRPLLPGGLPRGGLDPALLAPRQGARPTPSTTTWRPSSTRSGSTPSRSRTTARPRAGCTTSSGSTGATARHRTSASCSTSP